MKNEPDKLAQVAALVASDSWALTFQTFSQYRSALLRAIEGIAARPERLVNGPSGCDSSCCIARRVTPSAGGDL